LLPDDPETQQCCDVLLTRAEEDRKVRDMPWQCCAVGSATRKHQRFCSPWGPPMPPMIVWADDTVACRSYEWRKCHDGTTIRS
jgi:hypothetical protein